MRLKEGHTADLALFEGLTQPQATVSAALIALVAAVVALLGVGINVLIAERHHKDKQRAEVRERNRKEAVNAMVDALTATMTYWRLAGAVDDIRIGLVDFEPPTESELTAARNEMIAAQAKLQLLGLDEDSVDKVRVEIRRLQRAFDMSPAKTVDWKNAHQERKAMIQGFRETLERFDK
ncbi:hypothetical protein [Nocardia farcinica]|uniref:hypothetical protein n=1 Tax=Nocardia farcinica TaxID=37329 RepID=UPI001E374AA4|nr:hypothetical protein [Nocardia farcinica]